MRRDAEAGGVPFRRLLLALEHLHHELRRANTEVAAGAAAEIFVEIFIFSNNQYQTISTPQALMARPGCATAAIIS
jgi:hypothetical protein